MRELWDSGFNFLRPIRPWTVLRVRIYFFPVLCSFFLLSSLTKDGIFNSHILCSTNHAPQFLYGAPVFYRCVYACVWVCVCTHTLTQAHEWAHMLTCSRWGSPYLSLLTPGGPLKMSGICSTARMPVPLLLNTQGVCVGRGIQILKTAMFSTTESSETFGARGILL